MFGTLAPIAPPRPDATATEYAEYQRKLTTKGNLEAVAAAIMGIAFIVAICAAGLILMVAVTA